MTHLPIDRPATELGDQPEAPADRVDKDCGNADGVTYRYDRFGRPIGFAGGWPDWAKGLAGIKSGSLREEGATQTNCEEWSAEKQKALRVGEWVFSYLGPDGAVWSINGDESDR